MALNLRETLGRLRTRAGGSKLKRRKVLDSVVWTHFSKFRSLLLVVGYLWILCLPIKELSRGIYIDENALQPGGVCPINFRSPLPPLTRVPQVNTNWNWGEVHRADLYLGELEELRDNNATAIEWVGSYYVVIIVTYISQTRRIYQPPVPKTTDTRLRPKL